MRQARLRFHAQRALHVQNHSSALIMQIICEHSTAGFTAGVSGMIGHATVRDCSSSDQTATAQGPACSQYSSSESTTAGLNDNAVQNCDSGLESKYTGAPNAHGAVPDCSVHMCSSRQKQPEPPAMRMPSTQSGASKVASLSDAMNGLERLLSQQRTQLDASRGSGRQERPCGIAFQPSVACTQNCPSAQCAAQTCIQSDHAAQGGQTASPRVWGGTWPRSLVLHPADPLDQTSTEMVLRGGFAQDPGPAQQPQQVQRKLLDAREQNCRLRTSLLDWKQSYVQLQAELHCVRQTAQAEQARAVAECLCQAEQDCHKANAGLQVCAPCT